MESILIFIAIFVIDTLIKRANAKKKQQEEEQANANEDEQEYMDEQVPSEPVSSSRKLQEYIKQFEAAQREASQGTLEPAMPPPIPESHHRLGNHVTMREVAENIVQLDIIDIEYLMDEFGMSEGSAIEMINELQQHRIIGRDMGEGEYDVLVQDLAELNNLLSRESKANEKALDNAPQADVSSAAVHDTSDKQSQLKILEERARRAREEAAEASRQSDRENGYTGEASENADPLARRTMVRSINRDSVRRGFIWGKVIDEPRFKKRWSPVNR